MIKETRVQAGLRQDDLAYRCSRLGLNINRGVVAMIESGRRRIQLDELLIIAAALDVSPSALIAGDNEVQLGETFTTTGDDAALFMAGKLPAQLLVNTAYNERRVWATASGQNLDPMITHSPSERSIVEDAVIKRIASREAEQRLAKRLGVDPEALASACFERWGCGLSEQRDRRVQAQVESGQSSGSRTQIAAAVTWALADELRGVLPIGKFPEAADEQ